MTTDNVRPETLPNEALQDLQALVGKINEEKGFHGHGNTLRARVAVETSARSNDGGESLHLANAALRNYYVAKLALITTEVAEAIEELRNGRAVNETYYPSRWPRMVGIFKPEGVPSEVADIVIRAFDFAYEAGFDLAEIIDEKLRFNETREHLHGKRF